MYEVGVFQAFFPTIAQMKKLENTVIYREFSKILIVGSYFICNQKESIV